MSKAVILSRSFNAFISMTVSVWSVGFILAPLLLNAIIAGFFGFVVVVPLLAICIIAGAIALGFGLWSGYSRYCHLTKQAEEIASKYQLEVEATLDPDKISKKSPNTITLVLEKNKTPVAYFKLADNESYSLDLGFISPEEQKNLSEIGKKSVKSDQEKQVVNEIIQRVLSDQGQNTYTKTNSDPEETASKDEKNLLLWEKINAFFCDAPTIFALALIIIFLTTHVFSGVLIPSALLIAAIVSIAYGLFSALIKDKQSDAKLRAMNILENSYDHVVEMANALIKEVTKRSDRVEELKKFVKEIDPERFGPIAQKIANDIGTLRTKAGDPYGQLIAIKAEVHLEFSTKDIWRLVYAFIGGGITLGSCIYAILPTLLAGLGVAPLSLPVLLVIIGVASIVYGLLNFYNKKQMIERENWNKIDNEAIERIRGKIEKGKTVENTEEKTIHTSLQEIDKRLNQLTKDLNEAERENVAARKAVEQPKEDVEKLVETWQPASSEPNYGDSGLGSSESAWWLGVYRMFSRVPLPPKTTPPTTQNKYPSTYPNHQPPHTHSPDESYDYTNPTQPLQRPASQ